MKVKKKAGLASGSSRSSSGAAGKSAAPAAEGGGKRAARGQSSGQAGNANNAPGYDSDDDTEGFGGWLRSSDGVAYMRLFVMANTLLVVMTMGWPHLLEVVSIVREMVGV